MATRIGILQTGAPPSDLSTRFGTYGEMLRRLLGATFEYVTFDVCRGTYPVRANVCDAYLITGSAAGVYDGYEWIETLKVFLCETAGRRPLIGVCFGHQIMAEAFGGRVGESENGWGIGLHNYEVVFRADWMDSAHRIAIPASHRDQIIDLPNGATVIAASSFTPYAALMYPDRLAISFQCHPEFTPAYAEALIEHRRSLTYSSVAADEAIATLRLPNDNERVASWIQCFIGLATR